MLFILDHRQKSGLFPRPQFFVLAATVKTLIAQAQMHCDGKARYNVHFVYVLSHCKTLTDPKLHNETANISEKN